VFVGSRDAPRLCGRAIAFAFQESLDNGPFHGQFLHERMAPAFAPIDRTACA